MNPKVPLMDAITESGSGRHTLDPIMPPNEEPTAKAAGPQGLEGGPAAHKPSPETQVSSAAGHIWDLVRDAIWGEKTLESGLGLSPVPCRERWAALA